MAVQFLWRWFILLLCLQFGTAANAAPSLCKFPNDFSHRSHGSEEWFASRGKKQSLGKWHWSSSGTLKQPGASPITEKVDAQKSDEEEFMKWVNESGRNKTDAWRFSVAYMERPRWTMDKSQTLGSFATEDLRDGDIILDLSLELCMSDIQTSNDPIALHGAPWEVRLASKLLRERAKGKLSIWAPYIKLLPKTISLPMFFSGLEMNNIQDKDVESEVQSMRDFAKISFQALEEHEISSARFNEFVWALSVVYSSGCQHDKRDTTSSLTSSSHYILPFFSTDLERGGTVYATLANGGVQLSVTNAKRDMPLIPNYMPSTSRDFFLFRGSVPTSNELDKVRIFKDVLDLVDWYSSTYGAVNNNRYLTWRLARDAIEALRLLFQQLDVAVTNSSKPSEPDFSVGGNGYVDPFLFSIFATFFVGQHVADNAQQRSGQLAIMDLVVRQEGTNWKTILNSVAQETVSRYELKPFDCTIMQHPQLGNAIPSAASSIASRLRNLLDSFSTDLTEDQDLLAAAAWEGMTGPEEGELPCPSCRWQTEQQSLHDNLAVKFRASKKALLQQVVSKLSCASFSNNNIPKILVPLNTKESNSGHSVSSLREFLDWCEGHDLTISTRLAITQMLSGKINAISFAEEVRGVAVIKDIQQGENLFSLPLSMGLYNNDSAGGNEVDGWDLLAARLLREKADGNRSRWAPYVSILPTYMPSPIYLESQDITEIQWWPVVRELIQVRKAIRESFSRLHATDVAWANFEEYKWAVTMVHSRAFTLPVRDDEQYVSYVLMPFMDMINHHFHYQADWMSQPVWDGKLEIIAKRHIKKGEELFASFGPRSNDNLFLYYGFVLEDNPFDTAQIFSSFEEAVHWFLELWTVECIQYIKGSLKMATCQRRRWQIHWSKAKSALEDVEQGGLGQSKEWAELMLHWADLGFQFLPYQPGPTIYPGGVVDPSFLAAFSAVFTEDDLLKDYSQTEFCHPWREHCEKPNNSTAVYTKLKQFFDCIETHKALVQGPLLNGHVCQEALSRALMAEQKLRRPWLAARISVALRCLEILHSLPSTIDEDKNLIQQHKARDVDCYTMACRASAPPTTHLQLTIRYRLLKKLLLKATLDKLLS